MSTKRLPMAFNDDEYDEEKEMLFLFDNIHSCDEIMNPDVWNPDWHQCPYCLQQFNLESQMWHKTKKEITH